ncbi:MAG TPA: response regulator [Verrucomicrobiae bacterium]|nr:response regulator [Verrucomicrobiae bacterium]
MTNQPLILVVEDSEDHIFLLQLAFKKAGVTNPVHEVRSGEEAISYLGGTGNFTDWSRYPLPAIVLLDLKMPGIDGLGVLRWIREQPGLKHLRVVMLTSSDLDQEVTQAHDLGAKSFLIKPVDLDKLVEMMKAFRTYWLEFDKAPKTSRS